MTDHDAQQPIQRHGLTCEDCTAGPASDNIRITTIGEHGVEETWHTPQCPAYLVERILLDASAESVKEREGTAREAFPAVRQRLLEAAASPPVGSAAAPFVAALTELVQVQADTTGFVVLSTWVEILDRHFPSPDPSGSS